MMYGAEPCQGLHADLRARVDRCNLSSKYRILSCGAEPHSLLPELENQGLLPTGKNDSGKKGGVFDTIVCVRVLCSVPQPAETIEGLYQLLKPGGKMLICEHVANPWKTRKGSLVARVIQGLYQMLGWSFFIGDCHMNRDTGKILREVANHDGGWESVDMETSFGWSSLPYISGVLVKK